MKKKINKGYSIQTHLSILFLYFRHILSDEELAVSAVTGQGLGELLNRIQQKMFDNESMYMMKKLRIPSSGEHLG